MSALSNDEYRRLLDQPEMTDDDVDEFRSALCAFLNSFLDDYFREEFEPDPD